MKNYRRALSYAYKLDSGNYRDLVHSAYLSHYERNNGENLFDKHELYVMRAIRWYRNYEWQSQQYEVRGERFVRNHSYYESYDPNTESPDIILENTEAYENLLKKIDVFTTGQDYSIEKTRHYLLNILALRIKGFSNKEISHEMNLSESSVGYYVKKLKIMI